MRESNTLQTFLNQEEGLAWFDCITLFPRELAVSFAIFLEMNNVQHRSALFVLSHERLLKYWTH